MSNKTLSTAQEEANLSPIGKHTPVDIDKNPILFDGNPAHASGVLHEVGRYYARNGLFQPLLKTGTVLLNNGRECIDSLSAVPFLTGEVDYGTVHGFDDPCPPTVKRLAIYSKYRSDNWDTPKAHVTPSGLVPGTSYILSSASTSCG